MIVYITVNLINGKQYIGKDKNNNPKYLGSGVDLKKAFKIYGKCNFKKEILEYCLSEQDLIQREEYWLNKLDVINNPLFYNKTNKSFGNSGQSQETKNKISKALTGTKRNQACKDKMRKTKTGTKFSKETCKKISKANKGKTRTQETKDKISSSKKGIKHTKEHCLNIKNNRSNTILVKSKSVMQYDLEGNFIKEWESQMDAARSLNKKTGAAIGECAKGIRKHAYSYKWKYKLKQ